MASDETFNSKRRSRKKYLLPIIPVIDKIIPLKLFLEYVVTQFFRGCYSPEKKMADSASSKQKPPKRSNWFKVTIKVLEKQSNLGSRGSSCERERGFISHNTEVWENSSLSFFHADRTKLIVLFLAKEIYAVLMRNKKATERLSLALEQRRTKLHCWPYFCSVALRLGVFLLGAHGCSFSCRVI